MNLIEESFQKKEEKKKKTLTTVILIAIILIVLIIIGIVSYLAYIQKSKLRITLDDQPYDALKDLLLIEEDGTIYLPVKEISKYFGYESYNGEYSDKSEDPSKCYVQSEKEVVNVSLGSNKIYKLDLTSGSTNYKYEYTKKPIKSNNGVLYATAEAAEKIFNMSFEYDQERNRIGIYTVPYLTEFYSSKVLDYGYTGISTQFVNQKAILNNILVVRNDKGKVGVIDASGTTILEAKYDDITYLPDAGDFLVKSNNQVGILTKSKTTKVQIMYDNIELMDSDTALYVVRKDNKYGVIDFQGNIKVYIEYDEIGIDISKFTQNNIKNNYLLADNLIPVKKDGYWGFFNKNGTQAVEFKYDSIGYIASNNRNALNLLIIPDYNVIVACKDKKYTLVNSSGQELFATVADDIYMTIEGGEKHYYISVNDERMDAIEFLNRTGVNTTQNARTNSDNSNSTNEQTDNDNQSRSENITENNNVGNNSNNNTEDNSSNSTENNSSNDNNTENREEDSEQDEENNQNDSQE